MDKVLSSLWSNQYFAFKINICKPSHSLRKLPLGRVYQCTLIRAEKKDGASCPKYVNMDQNSFLTLQFGSFSLINLSTKKYRLREPTPVKVCWRYSDNLSYSTSVLCLIRLARPNDHGYHSDEKQNARQNQLLRGLSIPWWSESCNNF